MLLAYPEVNPEGVFMRACRNGHTEVVRILMTDPRVDPMKEDFVTEFRVASDNGFTDIVRLLLNDPRVHPEQEDLNTAFQAAVDNGHVDVIRLLMNDPRVDPSAEDNASLEFARENGRRDIMELLYEDPRVDEKSSMKVELFADDGTVHAHTKNMNELLLGINTNHIYIRDRLRDLANYSDAYHNTDEHDHVFDLPEDESLILEPRGNTDRPFTFLGENMELEPEHNEQLGKKYKKRSRKNSKKRIHKSSKKQSKKRHSKRKTS